MQGYVVEYGGFNAPCFMKKVDIDEVMANEVFGCSLNNWDSNGFGTTGQSGAPFLDLRCYRGMAG